MIYELVSDLAEVLEYMPIGHPQYRIAKLLDEAVCRDGTFLDQHPTTLFQCLWNSCWWNHNSGGYEPAVIKGEGGNAEQVLSLTRLLEHWHDTKQRLTPSFPWVRSLCPPAVLIGGILRGQIRGYGLCCMALDTARHRLFLGGADGRLLEWDLESRIVRFFKTGRHGNLSALALSSDGERLVSGDSEGHVQLWNAASMEVSGQFPAHARGVTQLQFLTNFPDYFASGSSDESVRIWHAGTGKELARYGTVYASGYGKGPVGQLVVRPRLRPYSRGLQTRLPLPFRTIHEGLAVLQTYVTQLAFNGTKLTDETSFNPRNESITSVTAGYDQQQQTLMCVGFDDGVISAYLWGGEHKIEFQALRRAVTSLALGDGGLLACGGEDGEVEVWSIETSERLVILPGHDADVRNLTFIPDQRQLISLAYGECLIWDLSRSGPQNREVQHNATVGSIHFATSELRAASLDCAGEVITWEYEPVKATMLPRKAATGIQHLAISPDEREITHVDVGGVITRRNFDSGQIISTALGNQDTQAITYSPDGTRLAVATKSEIQIWDIPNGNLAFRLAGHDSTVHYVAYSPNGQLLVSVSSRICIHPIPIPETADAVYRILTGRIVYERPDKYWSYYKLAFTPDASNLFVQCLPSSSAREDAFLNSYHLPWMQISEIKLNEAFTSPGDLGNVESIRKTRVYDAPLVLDLQALANGPSRTLVAMESRPQGTTLLNVSSGISVGWLPNFYVSIVTHPSLRVWAVNSGHRLDFFELKGDIA